MQAMRGGDADARAKITEMRTKQNTDIKALLTADQSKRFDEIMAAMPQGRRGGGPAPGCRRFASLIQKARAVHRRPAFFALRRFDLN